MDRAPKPKLFKSKFGNGDGLCPAPKKKYGYLGAPVSEPPNPHNFLRKHEGRQCYAAITKQEPMTPAKSKTVVSKLSECLPSLKPSTTWANYEANNKNNVKKTSSKQPKSTVIIDHFGSSASKEPIKTCGKTEVDIRNYQKPRNIKSSIPIRKKLPQSRQVMVKENTVILSRTERKIDIDSRMRQLLEAIDQCY
ncbi:uncharacterized protein LOC130895331 [Diorhabda carinulata]|uniref:uncharacterized protein LOC130895331 n=1 Tax=Diorhabda carinulata TaxID=1163345 RepID=UPI0025A05CEE|nr:uncharacterized protein LOC130895331 [Diorhabda carinulata]